MSEFQNCGLGPCAAEDGHAGTCAQASGWDVRECGWMGCGHPACADLCTAPQTDADPA